MSRAWPVLAVVVVMMVVAFSGIIVVAPSFAPVAGHLRGMQAQALELTTAVSSYNWAGYAVTAGTGQVTKVSGAWVEPTVTCTSQTRLAAFWVGIDGYSSSTVEQTGTLAQCYGGSASYYAWWEMYPLNAVQTIGKITVHAGDHFTASVTYHSATTSFTMYIKDTTTGVSFSKTASQTGTAENSAECVAEAPGGASTSSGIYPLAKFGTVRFGSCTATIGGVLRGIGSFSSVDQITMISYPSGAHDLATPSGLTSNKTFHVTWKHAT